MNTTETTTTRDVVVNMSLSIDGRYHGPAGPHDMSWIVPYAVTDAARDHLTDLWSSATTQLLGRVNAEGFFGYWPPVADQADAEPRDRAYAAWMRDAEAVVLSRTLTESPWPNAEIVNRPAAEVVGELRQREGGDIVVFSSASVIRELLEADAVDVLSLGIFPVIVGSGPRLFEDGLPAATWKLEREVHGEEGAVFLTYRRDRSAD
ncbi:dihydrofolate reductase family protein [Agromyces sp. LHK192]|uniref:dihydrofolate reductase family protein n=1 Tax=Agromyces sp. LHK192 TaxID=2498704 RepID=UPI000FDC3371|nr:dihydrofolate reductase family protein [Agromyces sp. LHK192]